MLWYAFIGCLVGTLVGMLPGIGPLAGISMLLPVTFGLDATIAIVMLAGIYYGAQYGGSTTSILLRIPGEAASVMTCIDGYEMARKAAPAPALRIAAIGSFVAGTFGVIVLMLLAPPLASSRCASGRPNTPRSSARLLVLAYMATSSLVRTLADGSVRAAARHDRDRRDERSLPLQLQYRGARRRMGVVPSQWSLFELARSRQRQAGSVAGA